MQLDARAARGAGTELPLSAAADVFNGPLKTLRKRSVARALQLARLHETAAVCLALTGLIVGYVAWRLSVGTISISGAKPFVENALEKIVGGQTRIGALRLGWDKDRRDFVVTASAISATTDARTSPLALGEVNLSLNARALLAGRAQIARADLTRLQAVLVLDRQGRTAFGFGTPDEVLSLPRKKGDTKGLRFLLTALRQAVLPNGGQGRVEAIQLHDALLVVIDPDTGERLSLTDAHARVSTDHNDIVTVQAAGFAREMGAFVNVAVSASPDLRQRLALAAVFDQARLSKMPTSLRVGPVARFSNDTSPISGDVLVHLPDQRTAFDIRANLRIGAGRFQGIDVTRAQGRLQWNGVTDIISASGVSVESTQATVRGANGTLSGFRSGRREIIFDAQNAVYSMPNRGRISADDIRGMIQLSADNALYSAEVRGAKARYFHQTKTDIQVTAFDAVLKGSNSRQKSPISLFVKAADLSGVVEGRAMSSRLVNIGINGTRLGNSMIPSVMTVSAAQFGSTVSFGPRRQAFDVIGLNMVASQFSHNRLYRPNRLSVTANVLDLRAALASVLAGRATDVAIKATDIFGHRLKMSGQVADISTSATDRRTIALSGRHIAFDVISLGVASPSRINVQADKLGAASAGLSVETDRLSLSGLLEGNKLSNATIGTRRVQIMQPTQLLRPFVADNLTLEGSLAPRNYDLTTFSFRHRGVDLSGVTNIALAPRGSARVNLTGDIKGAFTVSTLLSAWPRRFLPETRETIRRLIPAGTAEVSRLSLAIPSGMLPRQVLPRSGIDLGFSLRDLTVTYLPGMSPITNVSGSGELTGNSLNVALPHGVIGNIGLSDATVTIPQFKPQGARVLINAKISGDISEIAEEIDLPPLAVLSKAQVDISRLSGTGRAVVDLDIPLKPNLAPSELGVTVSGEFEDAGLTQTFAGLDATRGNGRIDVVNNKTSIFGHAWLAGNLFDFRWTNTANSDKQTETKLTATGNVSFASLSALGLTVMDYADGPVRVDVAATSEGSKLSAAIIHADFINTNITLPGAVWTKRAGVAGAGSANLYPREGGGWNVQDVRFDSAGATLRGALDLSDQANVVDARFSRIIIPNAVDVSLNVTQGAEGLTVALHGDYLNVSPFLKAQNVSERAVALFDRPLTLSADIKRVTTADESALTEVHADIVRDRQGWRTLSATGQSLAGMSRISLIGERDGRRSISGVLSDAGFFAQLLYPGAPLFGGTAIIEGELPVVGANSSGNLRFTGRDIRFARPGATAIMFEKVELPMSVRGGVVTLREGQAEGDAYTVKANGYVDLGAGRLDLRGVATPGGLNRVLADIPLIGAILGGGADEGLLGMTFTANGSLAAPRLRTNLISALAPGLLRKLFEGEAPLSPQPRLNVPTSASGAIATKWPYGPSEDMSEFAEIGDNAFRAGPAQ